MAKIVYGVSGEGSGHSSRAREILKYLVACGHEVRVVSYDRGYRNLKNDFHVDEIVGLTIVSYDNRVSALRTLLENLTRLPDGIQMFRQTRRQLFKRFKPDCVITDFEPTTAYLAEHYDIPLISLDNQHRMRYMKYPCPKEYKKDALVTESVIKAMVPAPSVSLITTFYFGELTNERSFLFPPILRNEVTSVIPNPGDHVLVYLTSGFDSFVKLLAKFHREKFIVYGYDKQAIEGNLQYRLFSREGFLADLASAKAVVATAGFSLLTESLYLRLPFLALPMHGQFEQILNATMLDELGYGMSAFEPNKDSIAAFFYHLPDYRQRLQSYAAQDNSKIKEFLNELLKDDCRLLKTYHQQRNK